VLPGGNAGKLETVAFADGLDVLPSAAIVDVLCIQERAFGDIGLAPLPEMPSEP